jgi:hypothetical protein
MIVDTVLRKSCNRQSAIDSRWSSGALLALDPW